MFNLLKNLIEGSHLFVLVIRLMLHLLTHFLLGVILDIVLLLALPALIIGIEHHVEQILGIDHIEALSLGDGCLLVYARLHLLLGDGGLDHSVL